MSGTVDWGIDLGTTNSAIARMTRKGAEIIPVRRMNYVPSAVARDKRGDLKVGADALNVHLGGARWFKRLMGTTSTLALGDEPWTPEALSAEVLKTLRTAAKLKTNEDFEDVVITVPAMFSQPQCAATSEAARLAGLNAVALLQEPIAAATAYLSDNPSDGYYLVYDLGGGTFDVSLIKLRDGEMTVVEHGGDNYLGGADFDRAIFDWVLDQIDRKGGETEAFRGGWQRSQLLLACEEARVSVSDGDSAPIYLDEFDLPVAKLDLTRDIVQDLVSDLVTRTIDIARDRLHAAPSGVRAVLLVGGPTQMPYVRQRLVDALGLPLSFDQDPMTVVAEGAAIHAGTIVKRTQTVSASGDAGTAQLELFYDPVSPEEYTTVAGKVRKPSEFSGEVRLSSADGAWESGWRKLVNGAFSTEVMLGRHALTEFRIELRDPQGREVACEPNGLTVRSGVRAAQPVAPYNYGVVRQGGKLGNLICAGEPLPASGSEDFHLAKAVIAGSSDTALIYFVEGSSTYADENVRVGTITIRGVDIHRTLREGERVEVRVRMDESRRLTATVHVPILDEDFRVELLSLQEAPNVDDLVASMREATQVVQEMQGRVHEAEAEILLRAERQLEQLEAVLERVREGEIGEGERLQKQLADLKAGLRPLRDKYGLAAKVDKIYEIIDHAEELCRHFNDGMGLAKLSDARQDTERAQRLAQESALDAIHRRALEIFWEHFVHTRVCWELQLEHLRSRASLARDALSYHELLRKAEHSLAEDDYQGVQLACLRAYDYLPESERHFERFHDTALR